MLFIDVNKTNQAYTWLCHTDQVGTLSVSAYRSCLFTVESSLSYAGGVGLKFCENLSKEAWVSVNP